MTVQDFSRYKKIGDTTNTEIYIADSDPDILIIVPREGTIDNFKDACENVAYYHSYARSLGKPCGSVVVMSNMLSQDAEARRAYTTLDPGLLYGGALVVGSALSRALGSFFRQGACSARRGRAPAEAPRRACPARGRRPADASRSSPRRPPTLAA